MNVPISERRRTLLIVVTYCSFESLSDVINSIRQFVADHPNNYVAVVENSSDSRVTEAIESAFDRKNVVVYEAPRNDGFSHGVNLAYRIGRKRWGDFDYVVLLNPDVVSAGAVICELVNRAARSTNSEVGVWGVVLRDQDGAIDRGCARRIWNHRRFFSHLVGYHNLVKFLGTSPRSLSQHEIDFDQSELAMVSGALMCISTEVLGEGLDTLLPMYLEDMEVCLRSIATGRTVKLYPDLQLVHMGAVSRKSVTAYERALRIMELVEAPVQCMARLQGYRVPTLRVDVLLGGVFRFVLAAFVAAFKIALRGATIREASEWMTNQQRLAWWFMVWAVKGPLHRREVSLSEYFEEYAADG